MIIKIFGETHNFGEWWHLHVAHEEGNTAYVQGHTQVTVLAIHADCPCARSVHNRHSTTTEWFSSQALGSLQQCRTNFVPALQCPATTHENSPFYDNEFLGKRSTCPWVMCRNTDVQRQPRDIYYAKCLCTGCKGQPSEYSCQPIYISMTVSRVTSRGSHDNNIRVPVGCTCAKNR
ncbi:interleukin-17D-like isoform X2 [Ostrea edulis]|uniref:interleukin-17D-like isoform X2 n=1 Tax=Ostrea edulis TaxID=37623 RepID=UPI0020952BC0|nr:interleukin-17D-like isoform X2 [Ostrea edulis]